MLLHVITDQIDQAQNNFQLIIFYE
jgi:hypothetical protein